MIQDRMPITDFSGPYKFLSNFYPRAFWWSGQWGRSAEHHYQAAKSSNPIHRQHVYAAANARTAKFLGKRVILRPNWDEIKIDIMRSILRAKFQEPVMKTLLRGTEDLELIEGNTWGDVFWGQSPVGTGQNWLGRILMEIRADLK